MKHLDATAGPQIPSRQEDLTTGHQCQKSASSCPALGIGRYWNAGNLQALTFAKSLAKASAASHALESLTLG